MPNAFLTSNKQDYSTPWPLIEALEKELGRRFTLDVCASKKSAKAPKFYAKEDVIHGLHEDAAWHIDANGGMAFCNPEYGDGKIPLWISAAEWEKENDGLTTVFLLPANKVDQGFWHSLVIPNHAVWTVKGRVNFLDPETGEVPIVWVDEKTNKTGKTVPAHCQKQSNPQASVIVIVGPGFGPCVPKSFVWK